MELKIRKLNKDDISEFISLIKIFEEVFEMKNFSIPDTNHLLNILKKEDFIVFVAFRDGKLIGGLTAYTLDQYYSKKPLAYIYDLAVLPPYQRQGVGKELISGITKYCSGHGYEEVFVQADKVDDYAIDFYRKTSITDEEDVIHFYYKL